MKETVLASSPTAAAPSVSPFGATTAAASRLGIGIVGLGFGKAILHQLAQKPASQHFAVAGVCDMRRAVAEEIGSQLGVPAHASLDALLEDDSVAVVGLFTQPGGRAKLLRKILRAGKDVLTTKPFELDVAEARSVLEEARDLGRVVHLNSPAPLPTADLRLIEQWRGEYDLGRPVSGRASVWASYREAADGTWHDDPETCPAAPLFRLGIYLLNDLALVLGPAESVQLMASRVRTGRPTADNAQLNIAYRNGALGHVSASFCVDDGDQYQNSLVLQFERGTIYRNTGPHRDAALTSLEGQTSEMSLVGRDARGNRQVLAEAKGDLAGVYLWNALADDVRRRRVLDAAYLERIVESVRLIDAFRRAQKTGAASL